MPRKNSRLLVLLPFHSVSIELSPIQRLRLGSAQRTAALSEPKAGHRNPRLRACPCHWRNSPEAHSLAHSTGRLFPCKIKAPSPGAGSQDPDPNPESHRLSCFQIPKGTCMPRKLEAWEGENKRKSLAAEAFLSGLIKWFPDQGEGAPLDSVHERLFSRKSARSPHMREGKSKEQSPAASPAPPADDLVYIPSTNKPWQPLSGDQGHHPPARTTPQEKAGPKVR